jgi:hypothetical protein
MHLGDGDEFEVTRIFIANEISKFGIKGVDEKNAQTANSSRQPLTSAEHKYRVNVKSRHHFNRPEKKRKIL